MPIYFGATPITSIKKAGLAIASSKVPSIANPGQLVETLQAPPAQVTGLAVDATGDGTIDLSWTAPASDATITDYSVEYTPSGGSATTVLVGSAATSYQITGLTNDTEYSVRVAAVSAAGTGAYSTAVTGTPSAAFDPASITGLQVWYDASDSSTLYDATTGGSLVAADGAVARWEDKSGNGRHATDASSGPVRKASVYNGLDALRFTGSKSLGLSAISIPNSHTLFAVWHRSTSSDNSVTLADAGLARYSHWYQTSGYVNTNHNGTYVDHTRSYSVGLLCVAELRAGSTGVTIRENGTDMSSVTTGSGVTGTASGSYNAIAATYHSGDLCEILFYDSLLSVSDRDAVESYLMTKWGIV